MGEVGFLEIGAHPDAARTNQGENHDSRPDIFTGLQVEIGDDSGCGCAYLGAPEIKRGLVAHCRDEVIGGPGAFVRAADGFDDFARAVIKKLLQELDVAAAPGARPRG